MDFCRDEIYVPWHEDSDSVITALCDFFTTAQIDIEVHIFAHKQRVLENVKEWPDNFSLHFSKTLSDHALSTALIAYVLEKFQGISNELLPDEVIERKVKVFFIQKSIDQFEELKAMLNKKPFLIDMFSFKLLALSGEIKGSDFLFEKLKGKKRSRRHHSEKPDIPRSMSENDASDCLVKHGRRASEKSSSLPSSSLGLLTAQMSRISPASKTPAVKDCTHCDRRRGSKPAFSLDQKNLFCLACYLNKDDEEEENVCKRCLRSMEYEMVDQETSVDSKYFSKNKSIQCGPSSVNMASLSVACQTDDSDSMNSAASQTDDELTNRFYELIGRISANQDDLDGQVNGTVDRHLSAGFRLSEIPKNPRTNKYHCPFCPTKLFGRQEIFEVHLKNVHKKCNCSCDNYFESLEAYLEHFYEVFPLYCFISRKCPDRFRSIHHQAIHHSDIHYSNKPYFCILCYDEEQNQKVAFKDIKSLKNHAIQMNHNEAEMFFSVPVDEENENIPMAARSTAINYSG